jgi:hypothetical protein
MRTMLNQGHPKNYVTNLSKCSLNLSYVDGRIQTNAEVHDYVCSKDSVISSQTVYLDLGATNATGKVVKLGSFQRFLVEFYAF